VKRAILVASLVAASSVAMAQDRAAALPGLQKICQNNFLSSRENLAALAILRINLPEFCGCVATQMVATFSPADVVMYSQSGNLPANINGIWIASTQFCKAALMQSW